jgi:cell division control protein 6
MLKEILMADQTLFKDREAFETDYLPEDFNYRDTQLKEMAYAVRPALFGARPTNLILRGLPGTGKTTSVRHIFNEVRETTQRILPVYVNCQNDHTRFMVYTRIYEGIFGHLPPTSGVSFRRVMNEIGYALKDRGKVLLVCLDDANYLLHEGVLNNTLYSILRLYEEFQGLRTGVVLTVSNIDTDFQRELDSCVMSVMQPTDIYFSPYSNAEVEAILQDRIRQGIYSGVISSEVFDLIVERTLQCGDLRVGLDLIRRAVLNAERNARKTVEAGDVESAFDLSRNIHLANSVKILNKEEKKLLRTIAKYSIQEEHMMHSGAIFASVREETPMGYTTFFERLKKFDEMRLINLTSRRIGGNTKEISLRYDAEKVMEECRG